MTIIVKNIETLECLEIDGVYKIERNGMPEKWILTMEDSSTQQFTANAWFAQIKLEEVK